LSGVLENIWRYIETLQCIHLLPEIVRPAGFDETVEKMLVEKDIGKRKELILKAVKMLYDEVSYIPLNVEPRLRPELEDIADELIANRL
jgi:hypothetical protein